ncbi:MAG: universal stress protein [Nitrospirae bacterium]|nr:universal stress protein [Nitrospirota bacterium]
MKILVPLDGSDNAFNAFRSACNIAVKTDSYITAFYVNKGEVYTPEETGWISLKDKISDELEILGHEVIRKAYAIGRDSGTSVEGIISCGIPAEEILKYIGAHGIIKLITMGHSSKGKGAQEFVESTTKNVVSQSKTPVFVTSSVINIRSILIAVDNSDASKKAVLFGGEFAKSLEADISVISVIPDAEEIINEYKKIAEVPNIERHIKDLENTLTEKAEQAVFTAKDTLTSMNIKPLSAIIKKGQPADEVISEAGHYDLIIIGKKGSPFQKKLSRIANKLLDSHSINTIFVQ